MAYPYQPGCAAAHAAPRFVVRPQAALQRGLTPL